MAAHDEKQSLKYCPMCGTPLNEWYNYCPKCGFDLRKLSYRKEYPPTVSSDATQLTYTQPYIQARRVRETKHSTIVTFLLGALAFTFLVASLFFIWVTLDFRIFNLNYIPFDLFRYFQEGSKYISSSDIGKLFSMIKTSSEVQELIVLFFLHIVFLTIAIITGLIAFFTTSKGFYVATFSFIVLSVVALLISLSKFLSMVSIPSINISFVGYSIGPGIILVGLAFLLYVTCTLAKSKEI